MTVGIAAPKPAFPQLQRGHPLAQGLVLSLPMFGEYGTIATELLPVGRVVQNLAGTAATAKVNGVKLATDIGPNGYAIASFVDASTTIGLKLAGLPSTTNWSVAFWWFASVGGLAVNYQMIFGFDNTPTGTTGLFGRSNGRLDYFTTADITTTFVASDNVWYHVVLTVAGTAVTFYVNGALDSTGTAGATFDLSTANAMYNDGNSENFDGSLDGVHAWNRVLSAAEVQTLYLDHFGMYRRPSLKIRPATVSVYLPWDIPHSPAVQTVMAL